jgi:hypothetical protein
MLARLSPPRSWLAFCRTEAMYQPQNQPLANWAFVASRPWSLRVLFSSAANVGLSLSTSVGA